MAKVKYFIKDGKVIRETKTGKNVAQEEISDEEFNKYQSIQSKSGFTWLVVLSVIIIAFLYTIISQIF